MILPRIANFKVPRAQLLDRPATRAYIVQLWLDGHKQRDIARMFGYANATKICQIIQWFCLEWVPEATWQASYGEEYPSRHGEERKQLCEIGLIRYHRQREGAAAPNVVPLRPGRGAK